MPASPNRHMRKSPVEVTRSRLQPAQKSFEYGAITPSPGLFLRAADIDDRALPQLASALSLDGGSTAGFGLPARSALSSVTDQIGGRPRVEALVDALMGASLRQSS